MYFLLSEQNGTQPDDGWPHTKREFGPDTPGECRVTME